MIEVERVFLFDDNAVDEPYKYVQYIKKSIVKYFRAAKGLKDNFKVSDNLKVDFYYFKGLETAGYRFSSDNEEEQSVDRWDENLEEIFKDQRGCLVLCDFQWAGELKNVRESIYNYVKDCKEIIFVCYSTVLPQNAQSWVDKIKMEEHSCTIVDVALSMPKDMELKIRVLEEAIQDVW